MGVECTLKNLHYIPGGADTARPQLHIAVTDEGSDHHMSDCDTPTAADHDMEHKTQVCGGL